MGLMILFGAQRSVVLWVLLAAAIVLTIWEVKEQGFDRRRSIWWLLLVVMTHVVGYLALRIYAVIRPGVNTESSEA